MATITKYSDISSDFLISSRYRIVRHLLLIFAVTLIASQSITDNPSLLGKELIRSGIILLVILGIIYINIYVLTPKFLFENKLIKYALSLLGVIFCGILVIIISQFIVVIPHPERGAGPSVGFIVLNLFSIIIELGLLVAGTSTILLFRQLITNEHRINELENATMQSELEQLKNQINPHFLFNMLNNANVLIKKNPNEAVIVLSKLKDLLKYQINDSGGNNVKLKDEIQFLTDFLNLEKIRRNEFEFIVSVQSDISNIKMPPLLFIPFVENAVKHNNDTMVLSYVHLNFEVVNDNLNFVCVNSKPSKPQRKNEHSGLGLANIKRRLELLYGNNHRLEIIETEITYTVKLQVKL